MTRPAIEIAGTGRCGPVPADPRSIPEMVLEAVEAALSDAGIGFYDLDAAVTASVDLHDGLTASNIAVTEVVGAVMKPECRIAGDGLAAVAHAACQLWAGAYRTVIVVAHGKASMTDQSLVEQWAFDPVTLQPLGIDFTVAAGLQARALMGADPGAERRWAETAAMRWSAAGAQVTADDVLASPFLASPLRHLMAAPAADAACAVVLSTAGPAVERPAAAVLTGVGYDLEAHELGDRDLTAWSGLQRALHRACSVAGCEPTAVFERIEASCRYPHEEELVRAAIGLAPGAAADATAGAGDGNSAFLPSGGLYTGAAPVAAGLGRLIEAAGAVRAGTATRALAHGTWGPAGQAHAVAIAERAA